MLHAVESPEEIDGGGTRLGERVENDGKFSAKFGERFSGGFLDADGDAHGRGDTDGGAPRMTISRIDLATS